MSFSSSLISGSLSSPFSSSSQEQPLIISSSNQEQYSEIAGLPLKVWGNILTIYLNPKDFQSVREVNRKFRDLSKSLDQQKFPIVIGEIIVSYLGADAIPSLEGEFTLSDFIESIKERDRSEINTKSKKFSDLIRKQFEQELKNKEVPENYKELLGSIEKIVPLDVTLKVIKVLDLKKKIEFYFLLTGLSKERIEALQKACQDESLWESFEEVFNWIKKYQSYATHKYPVREIERFIHESVQNNKEEMAIELAGKIPSIERIFFRIIIEALVEWKGNEKEKNKRYDKAIELAGKIPDSPYQKNFFPIVIEALVKWEGNEKERNERYDKAIELAGKIPDPEIQSYSFKSIVEALLKWEGNEKEKNECYDKAIELAGKIPDPIIQSNSFTIIIA